MNSLKTVPLNKVDICNGFWKKKQKINREITVFAVKNRFIETGRFEAFRFDWEEGKPNRPHIFWDSDIAKWLESAAYIIQKNKNATLEEQVDEIVDLIEENQDENGYFNIYFSVVDPDNRFSVRDAHELYCAGHLIEAAIAYYNATQKDKFLKLMCKYADHIEKVFKIEKSAEFVTPGHEEIELALVKLYNCTGEKRYLELSKFFIDERGKHGDKEILSMYNQSHIPVRQQRTAEGHSVRACYLYSGMADIAREYEDEELFTACEAIFDNIIYKRMYITGGIGSSSEGEAFTVDYDLPNSTAYAETCAAISLAMFALRMSRLEADSKYADVVERVIYNGFLSGLSLDGKSFFYENPLEINMRERNRNVSISSNKERFPITQRLEVFNCSCCPPNVTRFIASIGDFIYSYSDTTLYVNQYMDSNAEITLGNKQVSIRQKTNYPFEGKIEICLSNAKGKKVAVRIPSWCKAYSLTSSGKTVAHIDNKGYAEVDVNSEEFLFGISLEITPTLVESHPKVIANSGKSALQIGPLVYCIEEIDNGENLRDIKISKPLKYEMAYDMQLDCPVCIVEGFRTDDSSEKGLYFTESFPSIRQKIKFIPYYAFANRQESDMIVWFNVI